MKKACIALVIMFLCLPMTGGAQGSAAVQALGDAERAALFPTPAMIELGRAVATANCSNCHGLDGNSDDDGKPHLAGQRTVYLFRVLRAFESGERADELKNHNNFLSEEAQLSAAVYYASLTPVQPLGTGDKEALTETTDTIDSGEQATVSVEDPFLSIRDDMRRCIKCHDESGNASGSGMPSLTAQDPEYFVTSMMAYVNGGRDHKLMKKLVGRLDEVTIKAMGVFYAVQEPLKTETQGEGDANVGRRLSADCESCHGEDGNAKKASMPTLAGQDAKYFIKAMQHYKDGTRQHQKMFEAVVDLTEQEIIDLASWYASGDPRRRDVRMPLKSTEWITRCERCHGIDGNSSDPRYPMLAGQDETYLKEALKAYASGVRENTTMHAMADPLSELDRGHISAYFASQRPKAVVYMQLPCEENQ